MAVHGGADDDGVSWQFAEGLWLGGAAEAEDELGIAAGHGVGDGLKDPLEAVLECAHGGIDEGSAVEAFPGEIDGSAAGGVEHGADEVDAVGQRFAGELEGGGLLDDGLIVPKGRRGAGVSL